MSFREFRLGHFEVFYFYTKITVEKNEIIRLFQNKIIKTLNLRKEYYSMSTNKSAFLVAYVDL